MMKRLTQQEDVTMVNIYELFRWVFGYLKGMPMNAKGDQGSSATIIEDSKVPHSSVER